MSPVPEPLSQTLRRLHEEATMEAVSIDDLNARARADETTRSLLPALADLVDAAEAVCRESSTPQIPLAMSLAALRERLGRKP